jgi:hypothetical protein
MEVCRSAASDYFHFVCYRPLVSVSRPFALRASETVMKWKNDFAEGAHKQDLEKAKQQEKPKL